MRSGLGHRRNSITGAGPERLIRLSSQPAFRRSPFLVCYWDGGRMVFHNYATSRRIAAEPITCDILQFLDRWRSPRDLFRRFPQYDPSSLEAALRDLERSSILERSNRVARSGAGRAMEQWKDWNPAAGFFHFSTKDYFFEVDPKAADRALFELAKRHPKPPVSKHQARTRQFALPEPRTAGEFPETLLARRTWRQFSRRAIPIGDLGTLLGLTWRVQRWMKVPGIGRFALKTAPSGGAMHPMECYVLVLRVAGLARGLYHYAADVHRLELVRRGARLAEVPRYLPNQGWYDGASAIVFMTAVFTRTQWKYRFPRAYRTVLIEAGHHCQNFCLLATWLGLAPFCTMALADSRIEKALGIDGVTESVLYAAGVGTRPAGMDWAPFPDLK